MIGDKIKQLREERGLSQRALARKSEISQATISAIESSTKAPSTITIMSIAKALNVSLSDIVDESAKTEAVTSEDSDSLKKKAMELFDQLPEHAQDQALSYLRFLATDLHSDEVKKNGNRD